MDEYGNRTANRIEDEIVKTSRTDSNVAIVDYGFIFLSNAAEYLEYFRLRAENRKKEAAKHLNQCLMNREASIEMERERMADKKAETVAEQPKREDALTRALHSLVDIIVSDERFAFITEQEIDSAVSVIKRLADSRLTYEQAAEELGCSVRTLHTRVWREGIKPDHTVYLRRSDVERLKCCETRAAHK